MSDMIQSWVSLGPILTIEQGLPWMVSHVAVPTVDYLGDGEIRLYFCSRDQLNRSRIGFAELNLRDPKNIKYISPKPILDIGELGSFDDSGVTPTFVMKKDEKKYLYYVGWSQSKTVRFQLAVGLAQSQDGIKFERVSRAPILDRVKSDPLLTATLSIIEKPEGKYNMWYISGDEWFNINGETFPKYNVKYASSTDGVVWKRTGVSCINYENAEEHAIARPSVIFEDDIFKMWYSKKSHDYNNYTIGYGVSHDGINWTRYDHLVKFENLTTGFDDKMQAYGDILNFNNKKYMFYNGNDYGKTGIGLAVLSE